MSTIKSDGYVAIKDCVLEPSNVQNDIEIGLENRDAKIIVIDNIQFKGKFNKNGINIFGTTDNSVVTISSCYFENASNAIRLSKRTNVKNVVVNIVNCVVDKWKAGEYAGLKLYQDYTSGCVEAEVENNLFAKEKINT